MYGFGSSRATGNRRGLFAFGLAALISVQFIISEPIMRGFLDYEARSTTASWASFVFRQLDTGMGAGTPNGAKTTSENLAGALEAALRGGIIHKAVVVNTACNCLVSLDADALTDNAPISDQLEAFLSGRGATLEKFPAQLSEPEWRMLTEAPTVPKPIVNFSQSRAPGNPEIGAELTFFHDFQGTRFALCLFIDMTDTASYFKLMLAMGGTILTLVLIGGGLFFDRVVSLLTNKVHLSEKQARFLAEHDAMTGLLNRFGFTTRAGALLNELRARDERAYLFQVDADKFKNINDVHGHATGDRVIRAIGEMLRHAFPEGALVARLGGDEFAVLIAEDQIEQPIVEFMSSLPTGTEILSDGSEKLIEISTSTGRATFPDDAASLSNLMKAADLALYAVKAAGRNAVGAYKRDMTRALERRHWELQGVREAISAGALIPFYQPVVNAKTGRVEGVEALARWNHRNYGTLAPDRFSHALEDPSVATAITREMVRRAAFDLRVWQGAGHDFSVAVNIGEADLKDPEFSHYLQECLQDNGIAPQKFVLEVTETAMTKASDAAARVLLENYRNLGGPVALDDFGTGHSSITMLKDIPYSAVKIDKSFVRDLTSNPADVAIIKSIVGLSKELGFHVIAEGIETRAQGKLLRNLGVDMLQGFLYGRPQSGEDLLTYLAWSSPPRDGKDGLPLTA